MPRPQSCPLHKQFPFAGGAWENGSRVAHNQHFCKHQVWKGFLIPTLLVGFVLSAEPFIPLSLQCDYPIKPLGDSTTVGYWIRGESFCKHIWNWQLLFHHHMEQIQEHLSCSIEEIGYPHRRLLQACLLHMPCSDIHSVNALLESSNLMHIYALFG